MIRTRFAPSPTGMLHVGGLRTALYSYLFAKNKGGKFLLRIEDTDQERTVEGGIKNILTSLEWAGIKPDEGVRLNDKDEIIQEGDFGPYIQSERLDKYRKQAEILINEGNAYYCFCTSERLDKLRQDQQLNKKPTGYDRYCMENITLNEARERIANGEKSVVRLKMPRDGETKFKDLIRGDVVFKNELVDDQVLIKSDGFPTYHLAVVVDDHFMQITHVIRGEEWISSTPKHLQLYKYFGWEPPVYAHLALLLNSDKSKLSKRQGDVAVSDYKNKGYLPEALVNFVAFLGWNPGGEREIFSLTELISEFDLKMVNKTGSIFNPEKLDWYNREYIKKLTAADAFEKAANWLNSEQINDRQKTISAIGLEKDRINNFSELQSAIKFVYELPDYEKNVLIWRKSTAEEVSNILPRIKKVLIEIDEKNWNKTMVEQGIMMLIKENNLSNGAVLWPLRVAASGQENSPGPFEIAEALGKKEIIARIEKAIAKLS